MSGSHLQSQVICVLSVIVQEPPTSLLNWKGTDLRCGRPRFRTPAGSTLRVYYSIVWYTLLKSRRHASPNNIKAGFHGSGGPVFTNILYKNVSIFVAGKISSQVESVFTKVNR